MHLLRSILKGKRHALPISFLLSVGWNWIIIKPQQPNRTMKWQREWKQHTRWSNKVGLQAKLIITRNCLIEQFWGFSVIMQQLSQCWTTPHLHNTHLILRAYLGNRGRGPSTWCEYNVRLWRGERDYQVHRGRQILIGAVGMFLWDKRQHLRVRMFPCNIWNVLAHSAVLFMYETECQYRRGLLLWWWWY